MSNEQKGYLDTFVSMTSQSLMNSTHEIFEIPNAHHLHSVVVLFLLGPPVCCLHALTIGGSGMNLPLGPSNARASHRETRSKSL